MFARPGRRAMQDRAPSNVAFKKKPGRLHARASLASMGGEDLAFCELRICFHAQFGDVETVDLVLFADTDAHGCFEDEPYNQ